MSKSLTALFLLAAIGLYASDKESWSYHGTTGPGYWACLDGANAECNQGREQSPIDLSTLSKREKAPALIFKYPEDAKLELYNNSHTVTGTPPKESAYLTLNGKTYFLIEIHFHTRSEHTIDGKDFDMEMHMVHQTTEKETAVIGYFLSIGQTNQVLEPVFSNLPSPKNSYTVQSFNYSGLVPEDTTMFRYPGSLTTPGCGQKLSWHVLKTPLQISQEQFDAFHKLFSGPEFPYGNRRPTQPLNGRQILLTP